MITDRHRWHACPLDESLKRFRAILLLLSAPPVLLHDLHIVRGSKGGTSGASERLMMPELRSPPYARTHTHTQRRTDADADAHRQTHADRQTHTERHRDTETQRQRDTETQRHRDADTRFGKSRTLKTCTQLDMTEERKRKNEE